MNKIIRDGIAAAGIMALLAGGCMLASCQKSKGNDARKGAMNRPVPVTAALAARKSVPVELMTFGTVDPIATVAVKAQVGDMLLKTHIVSGQKISKGQLLFSIDPRTSQAALEQAQAALARDRALAANALLDAKRVDDLLKKGAAAQAEYDTAKAASDAAAQTVLVDQAALDNARLQLERCAIHSPIEGQVGNIMVDEGNLIKANDVTLVVINQISPVEVFFSAPQTQLVQVRQRMAHEKLVVEATIPGEEGPIERGVLTFVDNSVDKTTGTIMLAGAFDNSSERLWPGQYVRVKLTVMVQEDAIVVPLSAVQTGQDEKYLFVIRPDKTVEKRIVQVARTHGEEAIISGVRAGEQVVTDGQLRLMSGAKVDIKPSRGKAGPGKGAGRAKAGGPAVGGG